jgi:hypothetical protein
MVEDRRRYGLEAHHRNRATQTTMGASMPPAANASEHRHAGFRGRRRRRHARRLALAMTLLAPFVFALDAFAEDTTPPVVKLQIKQGAHFKAVKAATMSSGEPLTVRAVVRDPQGVKSLTVSLPTATASTCTSAGLIEHGSFPIALPPSKSRSAVGLQTKLVTSVTIPYPSCHFEMAGQTRTGVPTGNKFVIVLEGHNRSSDPTKNHKKTRLIVTIE